MNYSGKQPVIGLMVALIVCCGVAGADLGWPWEWVQCVGGSGYDTAFSVQQTLDGGYVIAGYTNSSDGDMTGAGYHASPYGLYDAFVAKVDSTGTVQWVTCIGGTGDDSANVLRQVPGGFVIAGSTNSSDGNMTGAGYHESYYGYKDAFVALLTADGTLLGVRCFGGSGADEATSIQQIAGGFLVTGSTTSSDGNMTGSGHYSGHDAYIAVLNNEGSALFVKCIGGSVGDGAQAVRQISGGVAIAGYTLSSDGDMTGSGNHGGGDAFIAVVNNAGTLLQVKCVGGSGPDRANSLLNVSGGYIIAGSTESSDGDMTGSGYHGDDDAFVAVLDSTGTIIGVKCIGGSNYDSARSIKQVPGGFIIAGYTGSSDGDMIDAGYHWGTDAFVAAVTNTGVVARVVCLGGGNRDEAYDLQKTSDGGFVMAGQSESASGNFTDAGYHTGTGPDAFIAKITTQLEFPPSRIGIYNEGNWYIDCNGDGLFTAADRYIPYGAPGWTGLVGDWDGDGQSEIGIHKDTEWYLDYSGSGVIDEHTRYYTFGAAGWDGITGRWMGIEGDRIGVYQNGNWYLDYNGNGYWEAGDRVYGFGATGWTPVIGKWDAGGQDCVGIYQDGNWYLDINGDGVFAGIDRYIPYGAPGWTGLVGDWNADGIDEIGINKDAEWYLDYGGTGVIDGETRYYTFGAPGWTPVIGDWNNDGRDKIGIHQDGNWYLDYNGNGYWDAGDRVCAFGAPGWTPVIGKWGY